jgi:hypothetical protein
MNTDDLIQEIRSLPVEDRARAAVRILRSLNRTVSDVDQKWAVLATNRLQDIQAGGVKPMAGDDIFGKSW